MGEQPPLNITGEQRPPACVRQWGSFRRGTRPFLLVFPALRFILSTKTSAHPHTPSSPAPKAEVVPFLTHCNQVWLGAAYKLDYLL